MTHCLAAPVPLESDAVQGGMPVSWRMAQTLRRHILTGSFLGEPVLLEIDLEQSGAPTRRPDCSLVEVPVRMSVKTVPTTSGDVLSVEGRETVLSLYERWGDAGILLQEPDFSNSERLRVALLRQRTPAEDVYISGHVVLDFELDALVRTDLTSGSGRLYLSGYTGPIEGFNFEERYSPVPLPSPPLPPECDSAEPTQDGGFESQAPATSERELRDRLAGRWVGCSGFSGELYFDPEGNLQISSEGRPTMTERLVVELRGDGSYGITAGWQALNVVFSVHPRKLQLTDVDVGQPMVFSAVP